MPTKPLENLLDRNHSKFLAREIIDDCSPLLLEMINFATNVFGRCITTPGLKVNVDEAVLMLYLHIIEMTDGVEVLLPHPRYPLVKKFF